MPWKITIMQPGGNDVDDVIDLPAEPTMPQLQAALRNLLGAEHPEHVTVAPRRAPLDMFVDEDGHAKGLPVNESATALYRANWIRHHQGAVPSELPEIVGPAVLFEMRIWR